MKRIKVNGGAELGADDRHEVLFKKVGESNVSDYNAQEVSRARMLGNLNLALFFCRVQGRMARGEQ